MRAARHLKRRLVHSALLLGAISVFTFAIAQLAPGTFLDEMRLNPQISAQTIDSLRVQYGLDQPLPIRYVRWLSSVVTGQFGYSLAYNAPVSKLLWTRTQNTLLLGTAAMIIGWMFALSLGIWTAFHPQGWIDRGSSVVSTLLLGTPELALAMVCLLVATRLGILPAGGMTSIHPAQNRWLAVADVARHLVLPAVVLALAAAPVLLRHVRAAMLEAFNAPFIQAARGHGIGNARLLFRHALPVAANPLISLFGLSLAGLVSGSFLVEVITGWPGLGPLFISAIFARDLHVVVAVVMLFSVVLVIASLASDLLLYAIDPRVRAEC
ncbi:MAG TPA: ABC transporter permease [Terriglobales bacterium]|nr:ABC transporter permease [Terriglobales bacterium]